MGGRERMLCILAPPPRRVHLAPDKDCHNAAQGSKQTLAEAERGRAEGDLTADGGLERGAESVKIPTMLSTF